MNLERVLLSVARGLAVLAIWLYCGAIVGWLALRNIRGDSTWWLALANSLAPYLFLGLLPAAALALITRSRSGIIGWSIPALVCLLWFGPSFLPRPAPVSAGGKARVKLMTLNVNGTSTQPASLVSRIRAENPDVVVLQELNPQYATTLRTEFKTSHPYQALAEAKGSVGLGIISRLPLRDRNWYPLAGSTFAARWVTLTFGPWAVDLLNVHLRTSTLDPSSPESRRTFENSYRTREQQARELVAFATGHAPAIIAGDMNSPSTNSPYGTMKAALQDSFAEAGWGLGGTFPAGWSTFLALPVPPALLRLDYVWHTSEFKAEEAYVGEREYQSDHRPYLTTLQWVAQ